MGDSRGKCRLGGDGKDVPGVRGIREKGVLTVVGRNFNVKIRREGGGWKLAKSGDE